MPGAGKSTLLARLAPGPDVAIIDSQTQRDAVAGMLPTGLPYRRYRPLVHLLHRLTVVWVAATGPAVVAVHLPATGRLVRGVVAALAALTGREAHLMWLDVDPVVARQGQVDRGRIVPSGSFARHCRRARATSAALRAGRVPWQWTRVTVLDRTNADSDVLGRLIGARTSQGRRVPRKSRAGGLPRTPST